MEDATKIAELTFQSMLDTLQNHRESLSPAQLCSILRTVAPYVMLRKEKQKEPQANDIYQIFKMQMINQSIN